MKIILSRKGFDTGSGGCASPILPDGTMISLPIPDDSSVIRYSDIHSPAGNLGEMVESLSCGRVRATDGAHLDPDINQHSLSRKSGWRPLFGQHSAAQGHLLRQGISPGDLFLFFGLFQEVESSGNNLNWVRKATRKHMIWGWFQIEQIAPVATINREKFSWASHHPHFHFQAPNNTLYLAKENLDITGIDQKFPGAGVFGKFHPELQLTASDSKKVCQWQLPGWFLPGSRPALTYHSKSERWQENEKGVILTSASRGQEFVLDADYYPEAFGWLTSLMQLVI